MKQSQRAMASLLKISAATPTQLVTTFILCKYCGEPVYIPARFRRAKSATCQHCSAVNQLELF